jgi:alkylation response protein AidB-like acyl-CoA dehydrogenase
LDFEFTDDQLELRDAARSVLDSACPPALVRAVYEDKDDGGRTELWSTLVGLDWPALGVAESDGGLGLGFLEVGILAEEMGRVVAPTPYLATATQLSPMLREAGASGFLAEVAGGRITGTLALAEGGRWTTDAVRCTAERSGDGWRLAGRKSHVLDGATADELAVVARSEDGLGVFLVPGSKVSALPLDVIDPTMPLATVILDGVEVDGERVLIEPGDARAEVAITRVLEEATTALSLSTVATCRSIFETTLQYAKDRHQFGRPIGSFQALKHILADISFWAEVSTAAASAAADAVADDRPTSSEIASIAKAYAGDAGTQLAQQCLQVHGGIGFTWEHDLHFYLRRLATDRVLYGDPEWHRERICRIHGL